MHPHFYSIYSHIDRYHLDKKYSLNVVSSFIKVVEEIDYDAKTGRLDKPKYNEFNYVEFLNYIPLNTISDIVLNQFKTYIETVPFSNLKLFIKEYYNSFLYECEVLLKLIENGQLTWWDTKGNFDFYTYSENIYEYNMIVWESKTSNDLHFYELYLKSVIQLLNHEIIEQYNNSKEEKSISLNTSIDNSLKWQGTKLEFTELVKSLIESNKLNSELSQTEIFKRLKQFFDIDEFNENDKLKDIRKRTNTKTPLINVLENSLNNWITKKD